MKSLILKLIFLSLLLITIQGSAQEARVKFDWKLCPEQNILQFNQHGEVVAFLDFFKSIKSVELTKHNI